MNAFDKIIAQNRITRASLRRLMTPSLTDEDKEILMVEVERLEEIEENLGEIKEIAKGNRDNIHKLHDNYHEVAEGLANNLNPAYQHWAIKAQAIDEVIRILERDSYGSE